MSAVRRFSWSNGCWLSGWVLSWVVLDLIDALRMQVNLDLERARFGDRLRVRVHAEDGVFKAFVPSLILQPLSRRESRRRSGTPAALLRRLAVLLKDGPRLTLSRSHRECLEKLLTR